MRISSYYFLLFILWKVVTYSFPANLNAIIKISTRLQKQDYKTLVGLLVFETSFRNSLKILSRYR